MTAKTEKRRRILVSRILSELAESPQQIGYAFAYFGLLGIILHGFLLGPSYAALASGA